MQFAVPFYNFFSTVLARVWELNWMAKLSAQGREMERKGIASIDEDEGGKVVTLSRRAYHESGFPELEFKRGFHALPTLIGGAFVFGAALPIIEQAVSPMEHKKGDSEAEYWMKTFLYGWSGMFPFINSVIRGGLEGKGYESVLGLYDQPVQRITKFMDDVSKGAKAFDHRNAAKMGRDFNGLIAALFGLTYDQTGKVGQYVWNVEHGIERPANAWQILEGLRYGTQKGHSRDFSQYLRTTFGGQRR